MTNYEEFDTIERYIIDAICERTIKDVIKNASQMYIINYVNDMLNKYEYMSDDLDRLDFRQDVGKTL